MVTQKQSYVGRVHKKSSDKSIIVAITKKVKHPLLKKYYNKTKKFMVHDEHNSSRLGDKVMFVSCRPLSKRKSHILEKILDS